jgi:hypothetical protein
MYQPTYILLTACHSNPCILPTTTQYILSLMYTYSIEKIMYIYFFLQPYQKEKKEKKVDSLSFSVANNLFTSAFGFFYARQYSYNHAFFLLIVFLFRVTLNIETYVLTFISIDKKCRTIQRMKKYQWHHCKRPDQQLFKILNKIVI